jgi:hypothetical protein
MRVLLARSQYITYASDESEALALSQHTWALSQQNFEICFTNSGKHLILLRL